MFNAAMPRLNKDERNQAGASQQELATAFGVHQSIIQRFNVRLHQILVGSTDDRPRAGLPLPGRTVISAFSTCAIDSEML